ncbi:MAG: hypothetical protein AAF725_01865 [Acidobacteriota bacterium]
MNRLEATVEQARRERLYPSVILHGGAAEERRETALTLARALLCERPGEARGCDPGSAGACQHCRRLLWPEKGAERFHPDLHVLERDLRTTTSVDATKKFARGALSAPFEARGQVFVVAEAETLSGGGADALLKLLEEPPSRSPRHFLLLAPTENDLLVTLRSRSLSVFLGAGERLDEELVAEVREALRPSLDGFFAAPSALHLLTAAAALAGAGGSGRGSSGFKDPTARRPWATAAAALTRYAVETELSPRRRRALLTLAQDLLDAPRLRRRGIPHTRILDGLVARHLADV